MSDDSIKTSNNFFGIQVKNEFSAWQFLSIPILSMATVTVGVYLNA